MLRLFPLIVCVIVSPLSAEIKAPVKQPRFLPSNIDFRTNEAPLFDSNYAFGKSEFESLVKIFKESRQRRGRRLAIQVRPQEGEPIRVSLKMDRTLRSGETFTVQAHFVPLKRRSRSYGETLRHFEVRYTQVTPPKRPRQSSSLKVTEARVNARGWVTSFRSYTDYPRSGGVVVRMEEALRESRMFIPDQVAVAVRPILRTVLRVILEQTRLAYRTGKTLPL